MGFFVAMFGFILLLDWVISGGFITRANVYVGYYRKNNSHLDTAYWYSFWAAFLTWFLIGLFVIIIFYAIVGTVALFGSGVGEVGAAGAGVGAVGLEGGALLGEGAMGAEALVAEEGAVGAEASEGSNIFDMFSKFQGGGKKKPKTVKKKGRKAQQTSQQQKKKGKTGKIVTWAFMIISLILVIITGILSAVTASEIKQSGFDISSGRQLGEAYNAAIISACLCLGAAGFLLIGMIVYAVYLNKKKNAANAANGQGQATLA